MEIRGALSVPVRSWGHLFGGAQRTTMYCIAQIHGRKSNGHFQKLAQFRQRVLIVFPLGGDSENDIVVLKAFRGPKTMQGVSHDDAQSNSRGFPYRLGRSGV